MKQDNKRAAVFITKEKVPEDKLKAKIDYYSIDEDCVFMFTINESIPDYNVIKNNIIGELPTIKDKLEGYDLVLLVVELPTSVLSSMSDVLIDNLGPYYVEAYLSKETSFIPSFNTVWPTEEITVLVITKNITTEEDIDSSLEWFKNDSEIRFDRFIVAPNINRHVYARLEKVIKDPSTDNFNKFMEYCKLYAPHSEDLKYVAIDHNNEKLKNIARLTKLQIIYLEKEGVDTREQK